MVATLARAPKVKLEPTAPAGVPFQPPPPPPPTPTPGAPLRIRESVTAIGDKTGTPYFRFGDRADGQPETVQVSPSPGAKLTSPTPLPPMDQGRGPVAMDNGGTAVVGPDPLAQQLAAKQSLLTAQQGQTQAQQQGLYAQGNVLGATAGTFAPQAAVTDAQRGVVAAQGAQTNAQAGYIGQQQADTAQTQQEQAGIVAASQNYADINATAQAQNARNNSDYLYGLAGEHTPVDVATPNGADNANLPPGTRATLQTQEQLKTTEATNAENTRKLQLQAASEAVSLLGTNVSKAQEAAASAGLTLDDAKLMVAKAQNAAGYADLSTKQAGIGVSNAQNAESAAQLPPSAGDVIYTDPVTGQSIWTTPADAETRKAQDQRNFNLTQPGDVLYTDPVTGEKSYVSQDQANQNDLAYKQQFGLETAGQTANYNQQVTQAGQQVTSGGRPLGTLSQSQLLDLAVTSPANEQAVMAELMGPRFNLSAAQAYILISDAKPKKGSTTITPPSFGGG